MRHLEGLEHGFLVVRDQAGHTIGSAEVTQLAEGDRVTYHMIYRFRDGSVDDESTVYSQKGNFALVSDRHIQRGPFFPEQFDLSIEANGQTASHALGAGGGQSGAEQTHLNLEPGTAVNGMMGAILANLDPHGAPVKLPLVNAARKPRALHLDISAIGQGSFTVAGLRRSATIFRLHPDLGGLAGVVAPLIGKQPKDIFIWVLEGDAPEVVRVIGQMAEGGPVVDAQFAGAVFPRSTR